MEDIEDEPYDNEYESEEEQVMGYQEMQERGMAGADIMGTAIEGTGALARAQERLEVRTGNAADRKLLAYFRQLKPLYRRFAPNDEVLAFDKFHSLPNQKYKNPYAFLLGYIAIREEPLTKESVRELFNYAKQLDTPNISEADIIRYYRLLKTLQIR